MVKKTKKLEKIEGKDIAPNLKKIELKKPVKEEKKEEKKESKPMLQEINISPEFISRELSFSRGRFAPVVVNFTPSADLEANARTFITEGNDEKEDISYKSGSYLGKESYSSGNGYEAGKKYNPGAEQSPQFEQPKESQVVNPFTAPERKSDGYGKTGRLEGYAMTEEEKKREEQKRKLPFER
jgi:hypothetical protein